MHLSSAAKSVTSALPTYRPIVLCSPTGLQQKTNYRATSASSRFITCTTGSNLKPRTCLPSKRKAWPLSRIMPRHVVGSEENKSELQSLMRIQYAVFCLIIKIQYDVF